MKRILSILVLVNAFSLGCSSQNLSERNYVEAFNTTDVDIYNEIDGVIIMKLILPYGVEGAEHIIKIIDAEESWLKVEIPTLFNGTAWVNSGSFSVATRNYQNEVISLYKNPTKESIVESEIMQQQLVKVYSVKSGWAFVKVQNKNGTWIEGWLEPEMQCSNPYTICP